MFFVIDPGKVVFGGAQKPIEPAFRLFFDIVAYSQQGRNLDQKAAIWANFWLFFVGIFPADIKTQRILGIFDVAALSKQLARE
ncbi:MAG: hypothetical protein NBV76_04320 [Candidatus Ochrobactrum gambitense]|nr:MAG: hypothetical protein NBV76_04320 [Candidatus Ochrobactrum gambitense]WEK15213.1 MAG: hypothetical protein P0Y54_06640 [Candidatus Ochrobactrum gambitense]